MAKTRNEPRPAPSLPTAATGAGPLQVGLVQMRCEADPAPQSRAARWTGSRTRHGVGAEVVCLPELFRTY